MPMLPESLIDFVFAPVPFLAGIHQSYAIDIPPEVLLRCVSHSLLSRLFAFFQCALPEFISSYCLE